MTLVSYSDSDSEDEVESKYDLKRPVKDPSESNKRKRDNGDQDDVARPSQKSALPPLPPAFYNQYAASVRTHASDDPELHSGRTRQVPHVEGNWPTHIYLEWRPEPRDLEKLETLVSAANINGQIYSLLKSELGAQQPLHVSLSAPLVLKTEQKEGFEEIFEEGIRRKAIGAIKLCLHGLRWEPNMDRTRWFLVLTFHKQLKVARALDELLECCNQCALAFNLPTLYGETTRHRTQDPSSEPTNLDEAPDRFEAFHISIAWQLVKPSAEERTVLEHHTLANLGDAIVAFDVVKLKIGNMVKNIGLGPSLDE